MLIVVEGPDASGKTTLLRKLKQEANEQFFILSRARPPASLEEIYRTLIWVSLRNPKMLLMMDRHPFISESVYGPLLRKESIITRDFPKLSFQIPVLQKIDLIIYCRPPVSTIVKNIYKNDQLEGVVEGIGHIVSHYDGLMKQYAENDLNVLHYNYLKQSREEIWTSIESLRNNES